MKERASSVEAKRKILSACVQLFIQKGYNNTTLSEILRTAHVSNSTFQNLFKAKEGVLPELIKMMFAGQFDAARSVNLENVSPVYIYALETAIQMTLTELNENLRDIYVEVYTNRETSEMIFKRTASELLQIFGKYNPNYTESDFYELDIGTAGIMRNYMSRPCDQYFTLEKKLERFLRMTMCIYNVPKSEWDGVIKFVLGFDVRAAANGIMQKLFNSLAMQFHFELGAE